MIFLFIEHLAEANDTLARNCALRSAEGASNRAQKETLKKPLFYAGFLV